MKGISTKNSVPIRYEKFQNILDNVDLNPGTPEAGMRYPRQLSDSSNNILPLFIVTQDPNVILKNP